MPSFQACPGGESSGQQWDHVPEWPCRLHGRDGGCAATNVLPLRSWRLHLRCLPDPGAVSRATFCSAQQSGLTQAVQVAWPCQFGLSISCKVYTSDSESFYPSPFVTPTLHSQLEAGVPDNHSPPKPSGPKPPQWAWPCTGLSSGSCAMCLCVPVGGIR